MTKKNFLTLLAGVIGGVIFSLGLCMCLLPEWNAFTAGIIFTAIGAALLIALLAVRLIVDKVKIRFNTKAVLKGAYATLSVLTLGAGMAMIMSFDQMIPGIIVGLAGIGLTIGLIPVFLGFKK